MIFPLVPGYVRAISHISGYEIQSFPVERFSKERSTQSVLLYELFDFFYTFRQKLNIGKHQKTALLLKSDPYSLELFTSYEHVLKRVFFVEEICFLRLHEESPTGFEQELINGMVVGIKLLSSDENETSLADLEYQYGQQLEYLEYLRTMISTMASYSGTPQYEAKKNEMTEVKSRLEHLQLEIQKLKVK